MRPMAADKQKPVAKIQRIETVPAPIGGLNSRDAISAMPPMDAYALVNWIPHNYGVSNRKGYSEWATGLTGGAVGSISAWFGPTITIPSTSLFQTAPTSLPGKVFASTDTGFWDITNSTAAPAISQALSGLTNAGVVSSVNFSNSGGGWLLACSERDGYFTYDGTTWVKVTLGAGGNQVSVTDPTQFVAVNIWKRRAWFVVKSTSKVAYLPTDSIYGAGTYLDVGPLMKHGGAVAWTSTWTIDAGEGVDDLLVIAGENGDIIIYKGTDPSSSTTFALVGVWYAGEVPKGRQAFTTFGGDLLIVSNFGLIPLSYITRGGGNILSPGNGTYTDKIQEIFAVDISQSFNFFGWQILQIPRENLMVITVPQVQNPLNMQYVMNTTNNQWCQWNGVPMNCTRNVANWPLVGTLDGRVLILGTNFLDNNLINGTPGQPITGLIQPAFNYFQKEGEFSANKHFLMARPVWMSAAKPAYQIQVNTDFNPGSPTGILVPTTPTGALWDTAKWDVAVWGGATQSWAEWRTVSGIGFSGQAALSTLTLAQTILASIDYMLEVGGPM